MLSHVDGGILNVQKEIIYVYNGTALANNRRLKVSSNWVLSITFPLTSGIRETVFVCLWDHWNNHAVVLEGT